MQAKDSKIVVIKEPDA
ncbi:hypothetical protein [Acutalibacter muris]